MRPYMIINGVSSRQIEGLIIQSLPPITKPKMRTTIEDINGRDGDVVTPLGYAAYDKPVLIGLKGDYNVDDVISFFNTSGRVIFSNEIDKYYNFALYDAIDFNRLIRFKTANINLHVQPFKYSALESPIVYTNTTRLVGNIHVRNTGNIYSKPKISIKGKNNIKIYINDVQILNINLTSTAQTIIIDNMNATDESGNFMNRQVSGNYDDLRLLPGVNELRVAGNFSKVTVENYSRWI